MMNEENLNEEEENSVDGVDGVDGDGDDKKRLIIIIAGAVVLLLGAGAGLYFSGIIGGGSSVEAEDGEHGDGHGDEHDDTEEADGAAKDDGHGKDKGKDDDDGGGSSNGGDGMFLAVPTMNISLNSEGGPPRYLRLAVQLELHDPKDLPKIEAIMPRVIDKFQTYLRELRVKDLKGSGGVYRLQMELLWRVNQASAPVEVKDVLFQEILIQ